MKARMEIITAARCMVFFNMVDSLLVRFAVLTTGESPSRA